MALLGDVTANAASTNHKDPPQHYPVPERNATFDPRLRSFPFTMTDHASDIVEDGEELEELPHPNISVRNEPPNALPLPDALPHETREFVLHALCEEQYDLVQTDPALVERIYRSWSGDGAYLRSASHAQLKSACHGSSLAALSLAFEIQRLLREEMERAEMERASAAAEQPPRPAEALEAGPEGPRKTLWRALAWRLWPPPGSSGADCIPLISSSPKFPPLLEISCQCRLPPLYGRKCNQRRRHAFQVECHPPPCSAWWNRDLELARILQASFWALNGGVDCQEAVLTRAR